MIQLLFTLTVRQLLGLRRSLLMIVLAILPVLLAALFRALEGEASPQEFAAQGVLGFLVVGMLLPLVALVFGTAALGSEIEDGTAVYILSKPIARWRVVVAKVAGAWLATTLVVLLAAVVSGAIVLAGERQEGIIPAFAVAVVAGAGAYSALFVLLSAYTGRALVIGLAYVFIWEGIFTNFAPGTQLFSIREYTLGIADFLSSTSADTFDAELGPRQSIALGAAVFLGALLLASRRLQSFEVGERV